MARRRSLRVELLAVLALILMMATVSLWWMTESFAQQRQRDLRTRQLERHVDGLAGLASGHFAAHGTVDLPGLEQTLRPALGTLDIQGIVVRRIVGDEGQSLLDLGWVPQPPPGWTRGPRSGGAQWSHELLWIEREIRRFGASAGTPRFALRVVAEPSAWSNGDWWGPLLMASGIGVVLLVIGAGLLELQVLRPLSQLRAAVTQVAGGTLATEAPEQGPREIASLARDFNRMTRALAGRAEEIERQRRQLVRAEHLASVGHIAAGMAHEVGNPLAAILGYVELMLDPRTELPEDARDLLTRVRDQVVRIQGLIGQLLDYSRPATSGPEPIDLALLVGRLTELLAHDPRCAGVTFGVETPPDAAFVGDRARLEQVLLNLLVNAARAARDAAPPARVELRVTLEPERLRIEVQDTGAGVDDAIRPRLFEPFFTTSEAGEGTGLGLAICAGLIENMDGTLVCLPTGSRPPLADDAGPGAVFEVTLPLPRRSGERAR